MINDTKITFDIAIKMAQIIMDEIRNDNPYSDAYKKSGVQLLVGTACQESGGLRYNRQIGFRSDNIRGAWGYWQTEIISLRHSLSYIATRRQLRTNVEEFLKKYDIDNIYSYTDLNLCQLMMKEPIVNCLFARLHYIKFPGAIPSTLEGQANYWKKYYNTISGKGTPEEYIKNWNIYIKDKYDI